MSAGWSAPLAVLLLALSVRADRLTGTVQVHDVTSGESLTLIGARVGLEPSTLAADNSMPAAARLTPGQHLTVDNRHIAPATDSDGVVINIPQRMLFVVNQGRVQASFPVAVGRPDWPTPTGRFAIRVKEVNPTWDVPVSIQREMAAAGKEVVCKVPPGPANPLGTRWLGLSSSLGIHGTNAPASIFRFTTHGCVRLHADDATALFGMVELGTPVLIVYEPVLVTWVSPAELMLEVHRDIYRRSRVTMTARVNRALADAGAAGLVDERAVTQIVAGHAGRAVVLRAK